MIISHNHLRISPVKTSVKPLSWPALLSLTLFTKVPLELMIWMVIIMMVVVVMVVGGLRR